MSMLCLIATEGCSINTQCYNVYQPSLYRLPACGQTSLAVRALWAYKPGRAYTLGIQAWACVHFGQTSLGVGALTVHCCRCHRAFVAWPCPGFPARRGSQNPRRTIILQRLGRAAVGRRQPAPPTALPTCRQRGHTSLTYPFPRF